MKSSLKAILLSAVLGMVSACGGGGSSAPSAEASAVAVDGKFVDSPVQGLSYESASVSGVTGPAGEFKYVPGETVTFKLGGTTLGSAMGKGVMTPAQISADATTMSNMLRVLQTLDADADPSNGIELSADMRSAAQNVKFNLGLSAEDFDADSNTQYASAALVPLTKKADSTFVGAEAAQAHFQQTLTAYLAGNLRITFETGSVLYLGTSGNGTPRVTGKTPDGRNVAGATGPDADGAVTLYCQAGGAAETAACFKFKVSDTTGVSTSGSWTATDALTQGTWSAVRRPTFGDGSGTCVQLAAVTC